MRRRRKLAMVTGLAAAGLYLVTAVWAGVGGPVARRPLLDGFAPPPPYRWVSPPASLESQNEPPASGRFEVPLEDGAGSSATVLSTTDNQASVALDDGAIPASPGQTSAVVTITPLAPDTFPPAPQGQEVAGNVYRIEGVYQPSGAPVATMARPAQVVLAYPSEAGTLQHEHSLLVSADGTSWRAVAAADAPSQHLIQGTVATLGYYAVARSPDKVPLLDLIGLSLSVLAALVVFFWLLIRFVRRRRARRQDHRTA